MSLETVVRATVSYWLLLVVLRMLGRRAVSQLTPFELLVLFLLGGITLQGIIGEDHSLTNAVIGVCAVASNHLCVSALKQRSVRFRKLVDGTPIPVVTDGRIDHKLLTSLRMTEEDVMASARSGGITRLEDIRFAIAERDGSLSIFRKP